MPRIRSLEELDQHIEQTYGADVLRTLKDSNKDQAAMVEELHKQGLNGRSEHVERLYRLHQQEFARKETLFGTVWNTTTNVVTAPFRWTWSAFKSHPVMTTVGLLALTAAGVAAGYYFAGNWELLMANLGVDKILGAADAAGELAPATPATPAPPGGGFYDVVPPSASPEGPIFTPD